MAQNTEETKKKIELEKVKAYFRSVIEKNDFDYEEFAENRRKWEEITGEEFDYDTLLDHEKQSTLKESQVIAGKMFDGEVVEAGEQPDLTEEKMMDNASKVDGLLLKQGSELRDSILTDNIEIVDDDDAPLPPEKVNPKFH